MKRVLLDMYLEHNLGDDLFLHIISSRYHDCKFTINCYENGYNNFIGNYKNIEKKLTLQNRILKKLNIKDYINNIEDIAERNDALVFLAGSYFMEPRDKNNNEYNRRKELIDAFKSKGKKVYILGSNFGPYSSDEFYNNWKNMFTKCDDVCFRDTYSYNMFKELKNVRKSEDVVLGYDFNKFKNNKKEKIVGFSIIDLRKKRDISNYYDIYVESIVKSINLFINKGYKCILMSFCESEGDLGSINDISMLLEDNIKSKVEVYEYKDNLEEAITLISRFEIFVATRFHASILGLLLDVCVIPIIYNNKTTNVLRDLNLELIGVGMNDLKNIYDEEYINKRIEKSNKLQDINNINEQFRILDKLLK